MNGAGTTFNGAGLTYNNVTLSGSGNQTLTATGTFANLTLTGTAVATDKKTLTASFTVSTTFTATGNSQVNRLDIVSNAATTARTITAGGKSISNVNFQDITAAGAGSPFTGTSLGDLGGNSSITFTGATTRYWIAGTGNWNDTAHWSTSSGGSSGASMPIPQDSVIFDTNSFSGNGQTATINVPDVGSFDSSAATNFTHTITNSIATAHFGSSIKLGTSTTFNIGTNQWNHAYRGASTFDQNGGTFSSTSGNFVFIQQSTNTTTLQSNTTFTGASWVFSNGNLNTNGNTVTVPVISDFLGTNSIDMSNSTINLSGTGSIFALSTGTNTLTVTGSTINITDTSATNKTFATNGKTFNNLVITSGGAGIVIFTGSGTFADFTINAPKSVRFTISTTTTILGTIRWVGTSGNVITIDSTTAGTAATISKTSGVVYADWLSLKDSTATGGANFYAGSNSTNVSGNTGWLFKAAPNFFRLM